MNISEALGSLKNIFNKDYSTEELLQMVEGEPFLPENYKQIFNKWISKKDPYKEAIKCMAKGQGKTCYQAAAAYTKLAQKENIPYANIQQYFSIQDQKTGEWIPKGHTFTLTGKKGADKKILKKEFNTVTEYAKNIEEAFDKLNRDPYFEGFLSRTGHPDAERLFSPKEYIEYKKKNRKNLPLHLEEGARFYIDLLLQGKAERSELSPKKILGEDLI